VVGGESDVSLGLQELADRVALVLWLELSAHRPPHAVLVDRVRDHRGGMAGTPRECRGGDLAAAPAVCGVVGARMVVGQVDGYLAGLVGRHRGVELGFFVHSLGL